MRTFIAPLLLALSSSHLSAEIPKSVPHQGRIAVSGTNFDGIGQFKFLLFSDPDADHGNANETAIWSNASTTPSDLSQPASAVAIPVSKGLYGTWLGDTSLVNMAALPASIEPDTGARLYLRIWFSHGSGGFDVLAPDQTIAAVPFALSAAGVTAGGITSAAIADGAVTGSKIAAGAVNGAGLADGSITSQKLAAGAVNSGALADDAVTGDKIATGAITEIGTPGQPGNIRPGPLLVARDFVGIPDPQPMAVSGKFVYTLSTFTRKMRIYDASDPDNPVLRGSSGSGLFTPQAVAVAGNYAYVVDSMTRQLQVYDVSDPDNIVVKDFDKTGVITPVSVAASGDFACVVDSSLGLQFYDVSNPDNIVAKDCDQTGLSFPVSVAASGNFAYVVDSATDRLQIFDVSDPDHIVARDFDQTGLAAPRSVAVSGNFAYVVDSSTDRLQIYDVSDPNNIIAKDFDQTGLSDPRSVAVSGNFAYVTDNVTGRLHVFDVVDPDNIVALDLDQTVSIGAASVAVSSDVASVLVGSGIRIFTSTGLYSKGGLTLNGELRSVGTAHMSELQVEGDLSAGSANVTGTVSANDFVYPSPKSLALSIPGSAMLEQNPGEGYFRSIQGYVQLKSPGSDTNYLGLAGVHLPQGAKISGIDLLYHDNSVANSFTNFSARFRRLPIITTSVAEENIFSIDNAGPSSPNDSGIHLLSDNTPEAARNIVDNLNFTYFVNINFSITAPDLQLRFYGFRIRYTLTTLAP